MKVTLIGGSADGQVHNIRPELNHIRYRELPRPVYFHELLDTPPEEVYRIEKLRGQSQIFNLGIIEQLPIDAAIEMLLDGYAKNKRT